MHMNKRRPNNNMGGGNGGQQNRHNNNRPRRFGSNNNNNRGGADDPANVARTRRNAMQSREKYQNMARDAMSMGDRVLAENYLQHADHYYRVIMALPPEEVRQPYQQRNQGGNEQQASHETAMETGSDNGNEPVMSEQPMPHADSLPAFITHPTTQQEPLPQENL
jgi:hypothetical protein